MMHFQMELIAEGYEFEPSIVPAVHVPRIGEAVQISTRSGTMVFEVGDVRWLIGSRYGEPPVQLHLQYEGRAPVPPTVVYLLDAEDP